MFCRTNFTASREIWSSLGGEAKLFCDNESKGSIKWYRQRSRKLIIQTNSDEHYLKLEFQKLAGTCEDNNPDADENFVNLITDISAKKDVYTADEESQVILLEKLMEVEVIDVNKQNHETVSCVVDGNMKCFNEPEVCGHVCTCTCSCVNTVVNAELEGLKLEMTILESRLLSVTSKSDNESEIKSLRVKLNDLEAVIRHQEE